MLKRIYLAGSVGDRLVSARQVVQAFCGSAEITETEDSEQFKNRLLTEELPFPSAIIVQSADLGDWIKRHPALHSTPVFVNTQRATVEEELRAFCEEAMQQSISPREQRGMDIAFAGEGLKSIQQFQGSAIDRIALSHWIHTVKGNALALDYPHIAKFLHAFEEHTRLFRAAPTVESLRPVFNYLIRQFKQIQVLQLIEEAPDGIIKGVVEQQSSLVAVVPEKKEQTEDFFQNKFKRISQIKNNLSRLSQLLSAEFPEEKFCRDLEKMVSELGLITGELIEKSSEMRSVSLESTKEFAKLNLLKIQKIIGKKADLYFIGDFSLKVDPKIFTCIESMLMHWIRNAMDHGIESESERISIGKQKKGRLECILSEEPDGFLKIRLKDDGRGIQKKQLEDYLIRNNLLTKEAIGKLSNYELFDFIFINGLSTKKEANLISGRGIGLGAVKESVVSLGGTLRVESAQGAGTEFFCRMPRTLKDE